MKALTEQTLDGRLAELAATQPDALAIIDRQRRFTYAELERAVAQLSGALVRRGLKPGGLLLSFPRRSWELPVLFLATARAGGVFVALDPRAEDSRVAALVAQGAELAFVPPLLDARANALSRLLGEGRVLRPGEGEDGLDALISRGPPLAPSTEIDRVVTLNFTSGTSGPPRGLPTTHAHIQHNSAAVIAGLGFRPDERYACLFAPYSHSHEHWARPLAAGATAVLIDTWRPRSVIAAMVEAEVTWLLALPGVYSLLLSAKRPLRLRVCEVGGAPLPVGLADEISAHLGPVLPIWGSAETTGVALAAPPPQSGLGSPLPGYQIRILDTDLYGGPGELAVRGPAVVGERGGWARTTDLVRKSHTGDIVYVGRRDELVLVEGQPVLLREIEAVLSAVPGVRQAALRPDRGEGLVAIVALTPGARLPRSALLDACRAQLPDRLVPRQVRFWDSLPLGPSGQIDRAALAARHTHPHALAVNSMIIAGRPVEEAFRLAQGVQTALPVVLDLRSRRDPASDPAGLWTIAHRDVDFDLGDPARVAQAIALSRETGVPIASVSAYVGACNPEDRAYGDAMIEAAARLAEVAPNRSVLLRVLGGDLWARARSLPGRWQDIRRTLRDEALATLLHWESHARQVSAETGTTVILGLEIHHGQYGADLHDLHHATLGLADTGWEHIGFLEDPANRFIAAEGDRMGAIDFARVLRAWGGRILGYHLKDVAYVSPWSQFFPQPMQRVGEPVFVWGMHKYAWTPLGQGELDLDAALIAAELYAEPPHPFCMISAEVVSASQSEVEAALILADYARLLEEGRVVEAPPGL